MRSSITGRMTPSADELAQRIGARLGALAWCATVGLVRIAIVGVYLVDKPLRCASRAIRRTIRRIACVGRARWMRRVRGNVAN